MPPARASPDSAAGSCATGSRTIRAAATFHPAYLLRTPLGKRFAWRDMQAVEAALAQAGATA